jgi:hypothetical protein
MMMWSEEILCSEILREEWHEFFTIWIDDQIRGDVFYRLRGRDILEDIEWYRHI